MSSVNFLKVEHRIEPSRNDVKCGIVDGDDANPAYTTIEDVTKWNATIDNPDACEFQFVPVDNNIIIYKANGKDKDSTCDGMLLVDAKRMIAFIELKDVEKGGFSDAIGQLKNTIQHFLANHQYDIFRNRRAYAANIAHPHFHYNMKDEMEAFRGLKFTLFPVATISLK